MTAAHDPTRLTVRANGDANHYALLDGDGRWFMSVLMNGEQMTARQEANLRRLAACWNACEGLSTEDLENPEQADSPISVAARVLNFQLMRQRGKLLDLLAELLDIDLTETARLGGDVPAEELMESIRLAIVKRPA